MTTEICKKHGEYQSTIFNPKCIKCEKEEERGYIIFCICVFVVIVLVFLGFRYLWAEYVYHDTRCIWAECRILK